MEIIIFLLMKALIQNSLEALEFIIYCLKDISEGNAMQLRLWKMVQ